MQDGSSPGTGPGSPALKELQSCFILASATGHMVPGSEQLLQGRAAFSLLSHLHWEQRASRLPVSDASSLTAMGWGTGRCSCLQGLKLPGW